MGVIFQSTFPLMRIKTRKDYLVLDNQLFPLLLLFGSSQRFATDQSALPNGVLLGSLSHEKY